MERHDPDEAEEGSGMRPEDEQYRIKIFEPESRTFVNADRWTGHSASSMTEAVPSQRRNIVPDPLSKFPSLHFVGSGGQRPISPASRSAARAHVMRQVCKERDDARRAKQAADHANDSTGPTDPFVSGFEAPIATSSSTQRTQGGSHAGRTSEDPSASFGTYPRYSQASSSALIGAAPTTGSLWSPEMKHVHHYIQMFAKLLLPMSGLEEARWFWKAMDDEACYHSTLFVSKVHQAILAGREHTLDLDCYRHKGEAISKINKRLNEREQVVDDGTIAAIACLAVYENLFGSPETAAIHIQGLDTIGNLRGGSGSDMYEFLERLVHWVELSNASVIRQRSRFFHQNLLSCDAYELVSRDRTISDGPCHCQLRALAPTMVAFQVYKGMTRTAATTFYRLQQLSHVRAQVQSVRDLDADTLYHFTHNVSFLERYINTVMNGPDCLQPEQCMPLYGSALAFIYIAFRDIPISSPILTNFAAHFKRALSNIGMEMFCQHFSPEFLLWILFLMTWVAQGRQDRLWFLDAMAWLTKRLELYIWEHVKQILAVFCMLEAVCEAPYRKIWIELGHEY